MFRKLTKDCNNNIGYFSGHGFVLTCATASINARSRQDIRALIFRNTKHVFPRSLCVNSFIEANFLINIMVIDPSTHDVMLWEGINNSYNSYNYNFFFKKFKNISRILS